MTTTGKALAVLCLLVANTAAWFFPQGYIRTPARLDATAIPEVVPGFRGEDVAIPPSVEKLLGARDVFCRRYRSTEGETVELFLAFYMSQNRGYQPHDPEVCLLGGGWAFTHGGVVTLPVIDPRSGEPVAAKDLRAEQDGWSLAVLSCHISPRSTFASSRRAKLSRIEESIVLQRTDALFVRLLTKKKGPPDEHTLYRFAGLILPHVYRAYSSNGLPYVDTHVRQVRGLRAIPSPVREQLPGHLQRYRRAHLGYQAARRGAFDVEGFLEGEPLSDR